MSRFLAAFETYFQRSTDAPREFGHTGGLSCLSAIALGRRWIQRGKGIHPNLYWVLVADSSRDRKSTSVELAESVVKAVEPERIGPNDFTPEGLADFMRPSAGGKPRNKLVVYDPEFGGFLARCTRSFGFGLPSFLCQLYDGQDFRPARRGKCTPVIEPRVSMLAACAYGMLKRYSDPAFWLNGFWARFVFVTPIAPRETFLLQPPTAMAEFDIACAALANLRRELKASRGPMTIELEAEQLYSTFAQSFAEGDDPIIAAQRERYLRAIWKLAVLYQVDENPQHPIGTAAVNRAITYISTAWQAFQRVYNDTEADIELDGNEFANVLRRVAEHVKAAGPDGISRREILRIFHRRAYLLDAVIDTLIKYGVVDVVRRQSDSPGRPSTVLVYRPDPVDDIDQ